MFLGKLTLSIPMTALYTKPVVILLENVYLLSVPATSVKYDQKKEEQSEYDNKMKILKKAEDAKQWKKDQGISTWTVCCIQLLFLKYSEEILQSRQSKS